MSFVPEAGPKSPVIRYNFEIFKARGVRKDQLSGTPYRYWSSYAIAHVFEERLSGQVNVLDAGGRDGGTLQLLKNLGLRGAYVCLDLKPTMAVNSDPAFEIEIITGEFKHFSPRRCYDTILFQSCLECVEDYKDIAWAATCLKPGGFVLVTLVCRNARRLYRGYWLQGGCYPLDAPELEAAFSRIGLRIVEAFPLGGATSRLCQNLTDNRVVYFAQAIFHHTVGRTAPKLRHADLVGPINRLLNPLSARFDYLFRFWRTGHCIVLQPQHHSHKTASL